MTTNANELDVDNILQALWDAAQTEEQELHGLSYTLPGDMTITKAKHQIEQLITAAQKPIPDGYAMIKVEKLAQLLEYEKQVFNHERKNVEL